jgi:hypothetical protein
MSFDVSADAYDRMSDPVAGLAEMRRVTRPGSREGHLAELPTPVGCTDVEDAALAITLPSCPTGRANPSSPG